MDGAPDDEASNDEQYHEYDNVRLPRLQITAQEAHDACERYACQGVIPEHWPTCPSSHLAAARDIRSDPPSVE